MDNGNKQKEQHVLFLEATDLKHVSGKAVPRQLMLPRNRLHEMNPRMKSSCAFLLQHVQFSRPPLLHPNLQQ